MLEGNKLKQVRITKLLGLIIRDDLSWKSNTDEYKIRALYSRGVPADLQKDYFCLVSGFSTEKCPNHVQGIPKKCKNRFLLNISATK